MIKYFFPFVICFLSNALFVQSENSTWFVNNYTKIERQIPMRDGIKLFTAIYVPDNKTEKHPILWNPTPYSRNPYGENNFAPLWET